MESALTVKGQATIPKTIRDHLRLRPGDRIKFFKHPDGTVVILPRLPASRLKGIAAGRRPSPASLTEMDEGIVAGATRNHPAARAPGARG
jgi:antitoxin PrlF